ncbi:MAG: hypothetical protein IKK93_07190 [Campylobacter sp.]|nr:hypothetical protein [Campylobacter sp.]
MTRSEKKQQNESSTVPASETINPEVTITETPDELFQVAEKTYTEAEEDLLKFVERQISNMQDNLLFGGDETPSFYKLNKSLMEYESTLLALTALYQRTRSKYDFEQEKYDNYYASRYVEVKTKQISLGKQGITTQKEIEMIVRKTYMDELAKLRANVIRCENEKDTIYRLIEGWKNYQFVLGTLSKNAQAEAMASGVSNRNPMEFGDEQYQQ